MHTAIVYTPIGTHNGCNENKSITKLNSLIISMIYTYTHVISHYNPSVWIIDQASHTTYVLCSNFIHTV